MADDRRWHQALVLATLVAVAVVFGAGCDKLEFKPLELPGFSLDAPTFVKRPAAAQYRAGQAEGQRGTKNVSISWETGGIMTVDEMPRALALGIEHMAKGETFDLGPARSVMIGGQAATQLEGSSGIVKMAYVDITCGKRSVTLTIAATSEYEKLRDRVLGSFRCTPVESEEAALGDLIPIGADDPATLAGWHYTDDDRSVFAITNDSLIAVFVETTTLDVEEAKLREMLPSFLALGGATFEPTRGGAETRTLADGRTRPFDRGELVSEGERMPGVTTFWTCDDKVRVVIGLALAPDAEQLTAAVDWLTRIRCSRPGDKATFD